MPDFTYEVFFHCETAEHFSIDVGSSKGDKTYKVKLGRSYEPETAHYEWSCECKGYQMRNKCRHIDRAKNSPLWCGWNGFIDDGEPVKVKNGYACPRCGSDAKPLRYAV